METRKIKISQLHINKGQIPGLPSNPRQWTRDDMDRLKKSIEETPELLEARGAIVYPWGGGIYRPRRKYAPFCGKGARLEGNTVHNTF